VHRNQPAPAARRLALLPQRAQLVRIRWLRVAELVPGEPDALSPAAGFAYYRAAVRGAAGRRGVDCY
jgi:hypothetical protein